MVVGSSLFPSGYCWRRKVMVQLVNLKRKNVRQSIYLWTGREWIESIVLFKIPLVPSSSPFQSSSVQLCGEQVPRCLPRQGVRSEPLVGWWRVYRKDLTYPFPVRNLSGNQIWVLIHPAACAFTLQEAMLIHKKTMPSLRKQREIWSWMRSIE